MIDAEPVKSGRLIGMDEAGYGPNLGPLVIAATDWQVCGDPHSTNLTEMLSNVVDSTSRQGGQKLHIADSKAVNVGKEGFLSLELSALTLLHAAGKRTDSFLNLWHDLTGDSVEQNSIPWFEADLELPAAADGTIVVAFCRRFADCLSENRLRCVGINAQIIPARQFNAFLDGHGSKGIVLSQLTMELLARCWEPDLDLRTLIIGDKHGGRNRYDELLAKVCGDILIFRMEEGREISRYRIHATEVRFQTNGERHFQVAAASIVAKYIRELAMIQFNKFWQKHCPGVAPTKGYPTDALRFRKEIEPARVKLQIVEDLLWRRK